MPADSKKKRYNLRSKKAKEKSCKNHSGNGDNNNDNDEEEDEMNSVEYQKFLNTLFPSKHGAEKIKELNRGGSSSKGDNTVVEYFIPYKDCTTKDLRQEIRSRKIKCSDLKNRKKMIKLLEKYDDEHGDDEEDSDYETEDEEEEDEEEEDEDEDEDDEEEDEEDEEEDDEEEDEEEGVNEDTQFNIVFTIAPTEEEGEEEEEDESDESEVEIEEEEEEEEQEQEEDQEDGVKKKSSSKKKITSKKKIKKSDYFKSEISVVEKFNEMAKSLLKENKNSEIAKELLDFNADQKKQITKLQKKGEKKKRDKNTNKFKKIIKDRGETNELNYFKKLDIEEQDKLIAKIESLNKLITSDKPYRVQLLEADIPDNFKACALKKISALRYIEPGGGEYYKMKNWVDMFMRIPFNKYENIPMKISDGMEKCNEFMNNAMRVLDEAVFGMRDAKLQIMQMLGQWISNPDAVGTAIALKGPPGTGKTTLVKEGISKILNRPFAFLALGGATDSSFLEGHGYTYEGSNPGKIIDILIQSKCMNPVIYFDEVDKISDTPKGEEIAGILTHLTDTTQNDRFQDRYFAELEFNLSKCLFIFSYNDDDKVNPILKDRMYKITTKAYDAKEKMTIAKMHLLPKIKSQVKFEDEDIVVPDESLMDIIDRYTGKESGVRNLKRCLEIIYTKLNLYRLMGNTVELFEEKDKLQEVKFPITITKDVVEKLLKGPEDSASFMRSMYL